MFKRMFRSDPLKSMNRSLAEACPDPAIWPQLSAYLVEGRRPGEPRARAALRAYLDLRDHLAGRAAFRCGAELSMEALAGPCRRFMAGYRPAPALGRAQAEHWARFLLAADHLLSLAYEARLADGHSGRQRAERLEAQFKAVRDRYICPLGRELGASAGSQAGEQPAMAGPDLATAQPA